MPNQYTPSVNQDTQFQVIDRRKRGYFTIDNVLLDVYGAQLGPYGIAVYCCLARFADADSECWPTYRTISGRTGVSRSQVIREIAKLEQLGIIAATRRVDDKGERMSHLYTLLDIIEGGSTEKPHPDSTEKSPNARVKPRTNLKKNDLDPQNRKREMTPEDRRRAYVPDEYADIINH